jgi:hypothetical protein
MATVEDQLLQVLANQQTIIANQGATLTAIQGVSGATVDDALLQQVEGQVAAIGAQLQPSASTGASTAQAAAGTTGSGSGSGS